MIYLIVFTMLTLSIAISMSALMMYYGNAVAHASVWFYSSTTDAAWREKRGKVGIILFALHDIGACVYSGFLLRTSTASIVMSIIWFALASLQAQVDINVLIAIIMNVIMYLVIVWVSMLKLSSLGAKLRHFIPFGHELWYFLRDRGVACLD